GSIPGKRPRTPSTGCFLNTHLPRSGHMQIAVEAHALSQEKITGVGNVILHYLNELQRLDDANEYVVYTMEGLKHLEITNPRWRHMEFSYPVKRLLMKTRQRWLGLKSEK